MAAKYVEKLLMLLSIHSTERLVFPKPGILVSTPGASLWMRKFEERNLEGHRPGGAGGGVVLEGHIVRPTLDLGLQHLVDVEPEVVPVTALGAPPVAAGLVQPGLYLGTSVTGDQDHWVEEGHSSSYRVTSGNGLSWGHGESETCHIVLLSYCQRLSLSQELLCLSWMMWLTL